MRSRRPDDLQGVRSIDAPVWADLFTARFWTAALDTGADTPLPYPNQTVSVPPERERTSCLSPHS
jgi:hypothetical protein